MIKVFKAESERQFLPAYGGEKRPIPALMERKAI